MVFDGEPLAKLKDHAYQIDLPDADDADLYMGSFTLPYSGLLITYTLRHSNLTRKFISHRGTIS